MKLFNLFCRAYLTDIHQRTGTILQKQVEQPHVAGGGVPNEANQLFQHIKDDLLKVKVDLAALASNSQVLLQFQSLIF